MVPLLLLLASLASADEEPYTLEQKTLKVKDGGATVDIGCTGKSLLVFEQKIYVACGADGIVILSLKDPKKPKVQSRSATEGEALGFFVADNDVWVRTQSITAHALKVGKPATNPPATNPPTTNPPNPPTTNPPETKPPETNPPETNPPTETTPPPPKKKPRVVFVPLETAPPSSSPQDVPDLPPPKKREVPKWLAPPRVDNSFSLSVEAKGFIPIGTSGFGTILGAEMIYRSPIPLTARARLVPLGMGWADKGNIIATSASFLVTLDTQFFEIGLGPGGMTVNNADGPAPAFVLAEYVRVGSADGLSAVLEPEVFMVSTMNVQKWDFAGIRGSIRVPVADKWMLVFRGAGSNAGFAHGDFGVRYRVLGEGPRKSVYLFGNLGGAGLFFTPGGASYGGPAIGLGIEVRP